MMVLPDNVEPICRMPTKMFIKLSKELSLLTLNYGQNVLKETNKYQLVITDKELPKDYLDVLDMLAEKCTESRKNRLAH